LAGMVWAAPTHSILFPQSTQQHLRCCKSIVREKPEPRKTVHLLEDRSRVLLW
jgi:hypothetical protein